MFRAVMLPSLKFAWCAYGAYQHTEYCHCFALTLSGLARNLLCCQSPLKGLFQDSRITQLGPERPPGCNNGSTTV